MNSGRGIEGIERPITRVYMKRKKGNYQTFYWAGVCYQKEPRGIIQGELFFGTTGTGRNEMGETLCWGAGNDQWCLTGRLLAPSKGQSYLFLLKLFLLSGYWTDCNASYMISKSIQNIAIQIFHSLLSCIQFDFLVKLLGS